MKNPCHPIQKILFKNERKIFRKAIFPSTTFYHILKVMIYNILTYINVIENVVECGRTW